MAEILRDFCVVSLSLEEQFSRYDNAGNLSYAVLRDILGDEMNRGILWRLKDATHHLFRNAPDATVAGKLLDWAIGYIFHETIKLMEDTHQHQYYTPSLLGMAENNPSPELTAIAEEFSQMVRDTQKDMGRTVGRIHKLLSLTRRFFHPCYAGQKDNLDIARMLNDREDLIRDAFAGEFETFCTAVYGDKRHLLFLNAALSLARGGKMEAARTALDKAQTCAPDNPEIAAAASTIILR